MDDLAQWLGEQLDADTARATAAAEEGGPEWSYDGNSVVTRRERDLVAIGSQDYMEAERGEFIAEHDPARVLRDVEAKRQLLADYTTTVRLCDEAAARIKAAGDHPDPKDLDEWSRAHREAAILAGPVRLLALPFSHRPGFAEAIASAG